MKILRSRKALSPVVASIILIAVTVAVSIAVAAWMGALSFSFMGSGEQLTVGSPYGWSNGTDAVSINVVCPGGNTVYISSARINNASAIVTGAPVTVTPGATIPTVINVTGVPFYSGYSYQIVLVTSKNHEFQTTGIVP